MTARRADAGTIDVRRAILEAATALFVERGADGLSMRQVAAEIGYSPTTIYLHFEDKAQLMQAVCAAGFEEFGATLGAAAETPGTVVDKMRAVGRAYVDFALAHPVHYDVMFIRPPAWAVDARGEDAGDPPSFGALTGLLGWAMETGEIRGADPRETAAIVWASLHGPVALALAMRPQFDLFEPDAVRAQAAALLDAALDSLI